MVKRTGVITFGGNPLTLAGNEIKVGAKAPDFYALNSKLQPVKLSDFDGKVRIISVFPSIDTP
ncbi:MAG TPA: redoxin domain-containing protein, partial [bacterium]|nr:redoxin domain-containing protein [bacterium]